jgi:hypothetical protein
LCTRFAIKAGGRPVRIAWFLNTDRLATGLHRGIREKFERSTAMQYILTGFTQDLGFRVFAFERIGEDRLRTRFTVRADLALIRRYGIRLQDLPLMCRGLLDRANEARSNEVLSSEGGSKEGDKRTFIFTEDEMSLYERTSLAAREAAAQKKRPPRRPTSENIGAAWRAPQP